MLAELTRGKEGPLAPKALAIIDNFRIDPGELRAIGRMGGDEYASTRDRFAMIRPKV